MKLLEFKNIKYVSYIEGEKEWSLSYDPFIIETDKEKYYIQVYNSKKIIVAHRNEVAHYGIKYTDLLLATARCKREKLRAVLKRILKQQLKGGK